MITPVVYHPFLLVSFVACVLHARDARASAIKTLHYLLEITERFFLPATADEVEYRKQFVNFLRCAPIPWLNSKNFYFFLFIVDFYIIIYTTFDINSETEELYRVLIFLLSKHFLCVLWDISRINDNATESYPDPCVGRVKLVWINEGKQMREEETNCELDTSWSRSFNVGSRACR